MKLLVKIFAVLTVVAMHHACGVEQAAQRLIDDDQNHSSSDQLAFDRPSIHSTKGWTTKVVIYVDRSAPESVVDGLKNAIASFNSAADRDIVMFQGRKTAPRQENLFSILDDTETYIYFSENWSRETGKAATVLGTTVWENDGDDHAVITRGDIILNAQNYYFLDAADATEVDAIDDHGGRLVDAETIILHELGHLLGLDHVTFTDDAESVMHPQTSIGPNNYNRVLSDGDIERIQSIYAR